MADKSGISWTDATWNPTIGCTRVSEGCRNCYAFAVHDMRHKAHLDKGAFANVPQYHKPFSVLQEMGDDRLMQPMRWRRPRRIFVNSMSDLFHPDVSEDYLRKVWGLMGLASHHRFQVFTKRPERMRAFLAATWPKPLPNVLVGVSVEDQATADERVPILLDTIAVRRAVSYEPAIGPVDFSKILIPHKHPEADGDWVTVNDCLSGFRGTKGGGYTDEKWKLDWLIVGGESGKGARPFHREWAEKVVEDCASAGVACHVKQMGSNPYAGGFAWDLPGAGKDMMAWPPALRVRAFPD